MMRLPHEFSQEIAAVSGALLSLSFLEKLTVVSAVASLASGVASAYYLVPPLAEWIHLSEAATSALGFIFGIMGFGIAAAIHQTARSLRDWLPSLVRSVAERKSGSGQ